MSREYYVARGKQVASERISSPLSFEASVPVTEERANEYFSPSSNPAQSRPAEQDRRSRTELLQILRDQTEVKTAPVRDSTESLMNKLANVNAETEELCRKADKLISDEAAQAQSREQAVSEKHANALKDEVSYLKTLLDASEAMSMAKDEEIGVLSEELASQGHHGQHNVDEAVGSDDSLVHGKESALFGVQSEIAARIHGRNQIAVDREIGRDLNKFSAELSGDQARETLVRCCRVLGVSNPQSLERVLMSVADEVKECRSVFKPVAENVMALCKSKDPSTVTRVISEWQESQVLAAKLAQFRDDVRKMMGLQDAVSMAGNLKLDASKSIRDIDDLTIAETLDAVRVTYVDMNTVHSPTHRGRTSGSSSSGSAGVDALVESFTTSSIDEIERTITYLHAMLGVTDIRNIPAALQRLAVSKFQNRRLFQATSSHFGLSLSTGAGSRGSGRPTVSHAQLVDCLESCRCEGLDPKVVDALLEASRGDRHTPRDEADTRDDVNARSETGVSETGELTESLTRGKGIAWKVDFSDVHAPPPKLSDKSSAIRHSQASQGSGSRGSKGSASARVRYQQARPSTGASKSHK